MHGHEMMMHRVCVINTNRLLGIRIDYWAYGQKSDLAGCGVCLTFGIRQAVMSGKMASAHRKPIMVNKNWADDRQIPP